MRKYIITEIYGKTVTAEYEDNVLSRLIPEEEDSGSRIGNIYVGRVQRIVKSIRAAFVEFEPGVTGYLALGEDPGRWPKAGMSLPVQVERDAVKSKEPVLTANLCFPGRYTVAETGRHMAGISSKITDESFRDRMRELLLPRCPGEMGIIVRTAAYGVPEEEILREAEALWARASDVLAKASLRTDHSLLWGGEPYYLRTIRDAGGKFDEILTDLPACRDVLTDYLEREEPENAGRLRFYEDPMVSLGKLCRLERDLDHALGRLVWLDSGGNIVIEQTEALTVIDVNSARYTGVKKAADSALKINLEAAREIARQLKVRNLSGIIVVDFINMGPGNGKDRLMAFLEEELARDPVKCVLVDMTPLGLVEITRKKIRRPLSETFRNLKKPVDISRSTC